MIEATENFNHQNQDILKELRMQINKGWYGPASNRTVEDIIADKLNNYKKENQADKKHG